MSEEMYRALMEVIEAKVKAMQSPDVEEIVRFNRLDQDFINIFIFGDTDD